MVLTSGNYKLFLPLSWMLVPGTSSADMKVSVTAWKNLKRIINIKKWLWEQTVVLIDETNKRFN